MKAAVQTRVVGCTERHPPLIPFTWPWLASFYVGIPLVLVILRPELIPDGWPERFRHYAATVVGTVGIGGPLHAAYAFLMPRWLARVGATPWRLVSHAVVILSCVLLGKAAVRPVLEILCAPGQQRDPLHESLIATVVASVVVMATTSYTRLQRKARDTERREEEARQAALRAELEALQARTNPHFLFNSLNTVASLIATDPECAEKTVERLSDLFRYALDSSRRTSVKLADELAVIADYLDVEALRLGDRLRYHIDVPAELDSVRVLPLALQPLVENAVLHGVACRREGGTVHIQGRIEERSDGDVLRLTVRDDGPGRDGKKDGNSPRGSGTALADLERRIEFAYPEGASLACREEDGWVVELRLPLTGPTG